MTEPIQRETSPEAVASKLRRERNWFAVAAVAMIAIAMAVALPRRVQRYRVQKALNTELLNLQARIGALQSSIGETEKMVLSMQAQIRNLQTEAR